MKTKEEVIEEYRVQSIREAATRVIARKGVAGASMQEIADEAGVAKGTLYLYFKSQQELLAAAIQQALTELLVTLDEAFESEGSFADRLKLLIQRQLEFFTEKQELFQIHRSTKYAEGSGPSATRCERVSLDQYQTYINRLTAFLSEGIERGEIRECDPRRVAFFIQEGTAAVLFQRMGEDDPPSIEEEVGWIWSLILTGIAKKKRARRTH